MVDIIIHDMTIDEFWEYDDGGVGYLIGTGRVDEVKHGHWKRSTHYKNIIFCDECGEPFELSNSMDHWNYCPNCGVRMDEDSNTHNTDSTR